MSIFEFFFKYKPIVYEKGRLSFQLLGSKWWILPVAALAAMAALYFYRSVVREKRSPWLIGLRAATLLVLLFMLLRPVLNISTVLPQDSYLAVVIDDSESMTIKDDGKTKRSEELEKQLVQIKGFSAPKRGRKPGRQPRKGPLAGRKIKPKYRNPADHSQTWAGRGNKPRWLTTALKSGKKLESFEIKK